MSQFTRLIRSIKESKANPTTWIPIRPPGLRKQVGIAKRIYHLIGGDPGTGKTSFVDQTYVLDAHDWTYRHPDGPEIKTLYFSMERSEEYKKAKWLAHRLYTENNIIVSVPTLLSWGTGQELTQEVIDIAETHKDYFDRLYQDVYIYDGITNPTGIYKKMKEFALEHGTIYGKDSDGKYWKTDYASWKDDRNKNSKKAIPPTECPIELKKFDKKYIPRDSNLIIQIILDHVGKPRPERGFSTKQTIDKTSEYLCIARDFYGMAVAVISQFNRNIAGIQRRTNTDLSPEQQDFKGSGNTFEDADVVLGLFNPHKYNLNPYKKYKINKTVTADGFSRFRSMSLLKNSYGIDNLVAGFKFVGECGYFEQIPAPENINYESIFNE